MIAHELGHLLLGVNSYSKRGLMSSPWKPRVLTAARQGLLRFSKGESRKLQKAAEARSTESSSLRWLLLDTKSSTQQVPRTDHEPAILNTWRGKMREKAVSKRRAPLFFSALEALDGYLASSDALRAPAGKLFQGPIADALTHVGQLALLRRMAGAPIPAENFFGAKIADGRLTR